MKKSRWKLPYIQSSFFKKTKLRKWKDIPYTTLRNSTIPYTYIGKRGYVYNGAWKSTILIDEKMVGFKIGEFVITKQFDKQLQRKRKTQRRTKHNK